MHLHCPHCQDPIEIVDETPVEEQTCPSCGSQFGLVDVDTLTHKDASARTAGHFQLIQRVGIGQFGTVWKARDTELDCVVAVKIPRKEKLDAAETEKILRAHRSFADENHRVTSTRSVPAPPQHQVFLRCMNRR